MQIDVQHHGAIPVVRAFGDLTGGNNTLLVDEVVKLLDQGKTRLVLDLSHVAFIGSLGIGDLVRVVTQANSMGGKVILAALSPFVDGVLKTTKLDRFFDVSPSVDEAVGRIGK
ncbi:Putative anti-sigma factor antagonist [Phycisphaerae bacterium RAS2]|nr:Putative anti-sigma factor antagonist [Phycisphaerae bacterium RAS2]